MIGKMCVTVKSNLESDGFENFETQERENIGRTMILKQQRHADEVIQRNMTQSLKVEAPK